jgi:YidC/Oxa1 family membrane protein insertase
MQYLPVVFAVFMGFYLTGLVIYYFAQAVFRIGLNWYITHRFYKGEQSLGRQAQAASERARELSGKDGGAKASGGFFAQAKAQAEQKAAAQAKSAPTTSKRVTPPKNKPTPTVSKSGGRPPSTGKAARPDANNSKKK